MGMDILKRLGRVSATVAMGVAVMTASGTAAAADVIKIGFSGPLSGGAALYGKNTLSGLELAAKEINSTGGVEIKGKKYQVEVLSLDDKYSPSDAAVNARRLVQQDKVPVVFVPHSGGAFALQAINERDGFLLAAYTSVPTITARGNKLTLRIPPNFTGYIDPFIKTQMAKYGNKVAIANADHDYAKAWTKAFVPAWTKAGGEIVANNPMSYNKDADFFSGVSKVLAAKPDVLFVGGASEPTALVVKQARELGFKGGFILMDQAKMDEMSKVLGGLDALEGAIGTLPLVADERPGAKVFVEKYRNEYKKDPTSEASLHYLSLHAVVGAMKLAGTTTDPVAIRANMDQAFKNLPAELNPNEIGGVDKDGGYIADTPIGIVENGKIRQSRLSQLK